jgi:hypothetical protein
VVRLKVICPIYSIVFYEGIREQRNGICIAIGIDALRSLRYLKTSSDDDSGVTVS